MPAGPGWFPRAPRWLVLLSLGCALLGVAIVVLGAWKIGPSYDEGWHVERYNNYQASGWYIPNFAADPQTREPLDDAPHLYTYGPVGAMATQLVAVAAGADDWGQAHFTSQAIAWRHIGVALLSLLTLGAVALLARVVTRHWGWSAVAGALLVAIPIWTGYSMMDLKDVAVACGFTLYTLGLALSLRRQSGHRSPGWLGVLLQAVGIVVAVGTRPGIWPGLALGAGLAAVFLVLGRHQLLASLRTVALGPVVGALLLAWIVPRFAATPVQTLVGSVLDSGNFEPTADTSRGYIPAGLLVEVPLVIAVLALVGAGLATTRLLRSRFRDVDQVVAGLVALQLVAIPLLAVVRGSALYTGLRVFLFAAPAAAVAAALALQWLLRTSAERRWHRSVPGVLGALVAGSLGLSLAAQVAVFPYSYTYRSPVALALGVNQADFWRATLRELAPSLPAGSSVYCSPDTFGTLVSRRSNDGFHDCASDPLRPFAPYRDQLAPPATPPDNPEDFYAVLFYADENRSSNCSTVASVERWTLAGSALLSRLVHCHLAYPQYPSNGFHFEGSREWIGILVDGWDDVYGDRLTATRPTSSTAFQIPASLSGGGVTVHVTATAPLPFQVSARWGDANGPVAATTAVPAGATGFDLKVPPPSGSGLLFLEFDSGTTGYLGLDLSDIVVTPTRP